MGQRTVGIGARRGHSTTANGTGKMTEQDLNAIVAWVRTVPPIE